MVSFARSPSILLIQPCAICAYLCPFTLELSANERISAHYHLATDKEVPLSEFKGKVVLVVNTASKCGFTYQYKNLESVYQEIKKEYPNDFTVIGFPCNQFGGQEPGSNEEIQNFCSLDQKVTFPVLGKINVNGDDAHPLYKWLKHEKPGLLGLERVKWNFEKFLIGRDGKVVDRWASTTEPEKFQSKIIEEIKKPAPAS